MEAKAQVAIEIDRARQLAESGATYHDNRDLAGTVVPMDRDHYDCISEQSAVAGKPLLSTKELAVPEIRDKYYSDVVPGQEQAGDWFLVLYIDPSDGKVAGRVQMILGNNEYADSTKFSNGPRVSS